MSYIPMNYEQINLAAGTYTPSTIKAYNNEAFRFWERALFQRATSVIKIDGIPDAWHGKVKDFLYYCLFKFGFVVVSKNAEYGYYFQPATLSGVDFYYQPTNAVFSNPAMKRSQSLKIGTECQLMKLTPDYMGVYDIITYYAEKLALLDTALSTSLINSKIPYMLGAKNRAAAQSLKKMLDIVNKGEPAVVYDQRIQDDVQSKDGPFQQVKLFSRTDYITDQLIQDHASILNNFDTEIGIQTLPYEKKERFVTAEADAKKMESIARCTVWIRTLNESFEEIKALYPELDIKAELTFEEVQGDGKDNTLGNEPVASGQ